MAVFVAVIIVVILSYILDHVRYWRRLDDFELRALEFSEMYEYITPKVLHGNPEDPEVNEFVYEGMYFTMTVKKGDLKALYAQLGPHIKEVQNAYDRIGSRYLELMDDETENRIERLHLTVESIADIVRYQSWLKGVK